MENSIEKNGSTNIISLIWLELLKKFLSSRTDRQH